MMIGETKRPLPSLEEATTTTPIAFIVSTNVDKIKIQWSQQQEQQQLSMDETIGTSITITADNLDHDLQIHLDTLSESDRTAWTSFVRDQVLDGVHIKFLLTKSE